MTKKVRRLFESFQPKNYKINLNPDRDSLTVSGDVTISGQKTGRPSQRLTFHQHGLKVTSATIIKHDKKGDREVPIARISPQNSYDEVRLHTDEMLYPGQYTVQMTYEGKITKPMDGIYPCYFKHDGKEKMLIATQFERPACRPRFFGI